MIDLSFLIPLVVIVVVMAKVSKEFSKVSRNRPTGGGSDDGTSGAGRVEGARSIAEFLEELKRQAQATQAAPSASAESDETLQARLREKVREAARLRREAAGHGRPPSFESPPPLPREPQRTAPAVAPVAPVIEHPGAERRALAKAAAVERKAGLEHPVFGSASADAAGMARRAMLLREILGPPVGLQGRDSTLLK